MHIWDMQRKGISQSEIARRLGISRQAVNQLAQSIPDKVVAALNDAARLNGIGPRSIDSTNGLLHGWSEEFQMHAVITVNPKFGLRVWYQHNLGRCKICPDQRNCRRSLLENAAQFGILLTRTEKNLEPSKLSSLIFSRLMGYKDTLPIAHKPGHV